MQAVQRFFQPVTSYFGQGQQQAQMQAGNPYGYGGQQLYVDGNGQQFYYSNGQAIYYNQGQPTTTEMVLLTQPGQQGGVESEVPLAQLVQDEIHKMTEFTLKPCVPIEVIFKNVAIWAVIEQGKIFHKTKTNKLILKSISGSFKPGTCTAILGSSGSGKTTLLNYLSSRMEESKLKVNGELYINGELVPSIQPIKHQTGYVTQIDIVMPDLTPREQFAYTARLTGIKDWKKTVDETINILNLQSAADTRVGSDLRRGISGGERKRTSVGIELITDPALMFLDEPTTGLDSKSALDIAMLLKRLAQNGRTVITTIHSPSAEILENFDKVFCLCYGEVIYDGSPKDLPAYFNSLGFPPPPLTNPADHLMTIIHEDDIRIQYINQGQAIDDDKVKELFQQRIDTFVQTVKKTVPEPEVVQDTPVPYAKVVENTDRANRLKNFFIVLERIYLVYFRNPTTFRTKIIQSIGFAIFALILFQNPTDPADNTARAISDIGGIAFFMASVQAFSGVQGNVFSILLDMPTFKRESQNKLYGAATFYITHTIFEIPFQFIFANIYLLIVFWATYMRNDSFGTYLEWLILFMCVRFSAAGVGDIGILMFKTIEGFNQSFAIFVIPLFLVSGFLANVKTMAVYMIVFSYLSFFRFGFQGAIEIELDDERVEYFKRHCRLLTKCNDDENPDCYEFFGNLPDNQQPTQCNPRNIYDFYESSYIENILILIAQGIFFRLIALALTYRIIRQRKKLQHDIPGDIVQQIDERKAAIFGGGAQQNFNQQYQYGGAQQYGYNTGLVSALPQTYTYQQPYQQQVAAPASQSVSYYAQQPQQRAQAVNYVEQPPVRTVRYAPQQPQTASYFQQPRSYSQNNSFIQHQSYSQNASFIQQPQRTTQTISYVQQPANASQIVRYAQPVNHSLIGAPLNTSIQHPTTYSVLSPSHIPEEPSNRPMFTQMRMTGPRQAGIGHNDFFNLFRPQNQR